ncbi:6-carboxytetrahydropterin synthase QueD [archaeon]|nr:6-carboxytetrahydropterin synthase QueD [archaeon]
MKGIIVKKFTFEAAHFLPKHPTCGQVHGHSFVLKVSVKGEIKNHFVIDFYDLKAIVNNYVIDKLDHRLLNDIFEYPSCEDISVWIWNQLKEPLELSGVELQRIKLQETVDNYFCYYGERD